MLKENLYEMGTHCGAEFRRNADPIEVGWFDDCFEEHDGRFDFAASHQTLAEAIAGGEIIRETKTHEEAWAEICGEGYCATSENIPNSSADSSRAHGGQSQRKRRHRTEATSTGATGENGETPRSTRKDVTDGQGKAVRPG